MAVIPEGGIFAGNYDVRPVVKFFEFRTITSDYMKELFRGEIFPASAKI
jgi:hypothetical protein